MSQLVIDVGNTAVKLVEWESSVYLADFFEAGFSAGQNKNLPRIVGTLPTQLALESPQVFENEIRKMGALDADSVVLVSVIPAVDGFLHTLWPDLVVAGLPDRLNFPHEIENPEDVGSDRFCNVAAAVASGLKSALVVDAGTATTFDLLVDGVFLGGLIAPGMEFAAQQLGSHGARLPQVPFETRPAVVGNNTVEAMATGAWLTGCGGVEYTLEKLAETYGKVPIILTGGLSPMLPAAGRYLDRFWTLRGAVALVGLP